MTVPTLPRWALALVVLGAGIPAGFVLRALFDATLARAKRARVTLSTLTARVRGPGA